MPLNQCAKFGPGKMLEQLIEQASDLYHCFALLVGGVWRSPGQGTVRQRSLSLSVPNSGDFHCEPNRGEQNQTNSVGIANRDAGGRRRPAYRAPRFASSNGVFLSILTRLGGLRFCRGYSPDLRASSAQPIH